MEWHLGCMFGSHRANHFCSGVRAVRHHAIAFAGASPLLCSYDGGQETTGSRLVPCVVTLTPSV
jgi:hypothetical protein